MNALIASVIGIASAYSGGYISDKLEAAFPMTKGILCGVCVLVALPLIVVSFSLSSNFWVSISFYGASYLFAEMWYGPCVSMFLTIFPSSISGFAIAVFSLTGSLFGAIANLFLGMLGDHYDTKNNP